MRIKLFEKSLPASYLVKQGLYLAVASTSIRYKKPIHLFDSVRGRMFLNEYKTCILYLFSEIFVQDKIAAKADQKCVL